MKTAIISLAIINGLLPSVSQAKLKPPQIGYIPFVTDSKEPDFHKNMKEIIRDAGFRYESHQVITEDGYILNLSRIPGSIHDENIKAKKQAVYL